MNAPAAYRDRFTSLGEFLIAAARSEVRGNGDFDPRLERSAAATGLSERSGSEGGFLVPTDFAARLWERTFETGSILARCDRQPISGNALVVPAIDERSRANGSRTGGVVMNWVDEAAQIPASKPQFGALKFIPKKLAGLCYVSDELLQDAPALEAALIRLFAREAAFCIEDATINGRGVGTPLGILNSSALITVAAEVGQASATITENNIFDMWSRLPPTSRATAVWLASTEVEKAIAKIFTTVKNVAGTENIGCLRTIKYCPPGENGNKYAALQGLEVLPVEYTAQLGALGDLVLVDFGQYVLGEKEPDIVSSIHVKFIESETAFRLRFRCDGNPAWSSPLTQRNAISTISPFVTLAARP